MTNPFKGRNLSIAGPATDLRPVTPSDTVDLTNYGVALYSETAGRVNFITVSGAQRSILVAAYAILPVGIRRVLATGTTATGLHVFEVA